MMVVLAGALVALVLVAWVALAAARRRSRAQAARVAELAAAFERSQEARLSLVTGMAHAIRNPLSVMLGTIALLEEESDDERAERRIALLRRQAERLERLVADLVDTIRAEAGGLELQLGDCDLGRIAGEVVERHRPGAPDRALRLDLPGTPVAVRADPARLTRVVTDLVSNALKYSAGGTAVDVRVYALDAEAVLAVVDQGAGIPAEEQAVIFEPFQRAMPGKARTVGSGIGLAVARRIVEAHGGRMELDSAPGRGSRFEVHLPLVDRPALARAGVS